MKIFGIIGWKNTGKTGLMVRAVAAIRARGFTVSTVKHAHHAFDLDHPGKDSYRHREAGAHEVLLTSHQRWALLHEIREQPEPTLGEILAKLEPVDLVLVEGYKRDSHAKIEVFREEAGQSLIQPTDATVRAVAADVPLGALPVPRFDLDDTGAIVDFILSEAGLEKRSPDGLPDACFAPQGKGAIATVDETLAMLRASLTPVTGLENIAAEDSDRRILAADVIARRNNPAFANSAMDGYGFAHASLAAGPRLALVDGRSAAGAPFDRPVARGEAVRILTGAALPEGVDTVVMQEHVTLADGVVTVPAEVAPGANVRAAGEELAAGEVALAAGQVLGPAEVGLITALGMSTVTVRRRLRVGVLSTGNELVRPGMAADPTQIFDANRPMLRALLVRWGCDAVDLGPVPDDRDALRIALDAAAGSVDAVLTSGGASGGDEDHVSALLREEGRINQWRVAMKPGKPLVLAQWRRMPIFGLPGNPVAAFVAALLFARPALSLLAGGGWTQPQGFSVPAGFARKKRPGRREFLRARLDDKGRAILFRSDSSAMISGLAWADGLVDIDAPGQTIAPGDPVRFMPFASFGL